MQIEEFIKRFGEGLQQTESLPLTEARLYYDRLCASFAAPDPNGMQIISERRAAVGVRRFVPAETKTGYAVYAHGGGFQLGSTASHHGVAASLASELSLEVISIDYRLAPEANYDEMLDDCKRMISIFEPAVLVGDSAGACLVMDTAYTLGWKQPLGLIYPAVGELNIDNLGPDAPLLSREDILSASSTLSAQRPSWPAKVPPSPIVEVLAVERDPLTSPLEAAVNEWRECGARIGYRCAPNMVHAALHAHHQLPAMQRGWKDFCNALEERIFEQRNM